MDIKDARIGMNVRSYSTIGQIEEIYSDRIKLITSCGILTAVAGAVEPIDDPCDPCQKLIDRAGELGAKDAEITCLRARIDHQRSVIDKLHSNISAKGNDASKLKCELICRAAEIAELKCKLEKAQSKITKLELDKAWIPCKSFEYGEIVNMRGQLVQMLDPHKDDLGNVARITLLPPGRKLPDISGYPRTLLEFLQARDRPMKLDDIAIGLMWSNSFVCENLAILRDAGLVKLEDGEYEVI